MTYFGAGAQGRRALFSSALQDQGAGCPGLLAFLVLETEHRRLHDEHPLCTPPAPSRTCWSKHFPLPGPRALSSPDMLWFSNSLQFSLDPRVSKPLHPPRMWVLESGGGGRSPFKPAQQGSQNMQSADTDPAQRFECAHPKGSHHHLLICLLSFCWPQAALHGPLWALGLYLLCPRPLLEL